jgi:chromosome segregation ATPase
MTQQLKEKKEFLKQKILETKSEIQKTQKNVEILQMEFYETKKKESSIKNETESTKEREFLFKMYLKNCQEMIHQIESFTKELKKNSSQMLKSMMESVSKEEYNSKMKGILNQYDVKLNRV